MIKLAKFSTELLLQASYELLHDSIDLLVVHGFLRILKDEVDSIRLLSLWQLIAFVNVEEFHLLQQFLLCLTCYLLNLCELYAVVNQQGEVSTDGRMLRNLCESDLVLLRCFHQLCPVQLSKIYWLLQIELLQEFL